MLCNKARNFKWASKRYVDVCECFFIIMYILQQTQKSCHVAVNHASFSKTYKSRLLRIRMKLKIPCVVCLTECHLYGSTFIKYENSYILESYHEIIASMSLAGCQQLCSDSTECRGYNYNAGMSQCRLLPVTPLMKPAYYMTSSTTDYYNRNCAEMTP